MFQGFFFKNNFEMDPGTFYQKRHNVRELAGCMIRLSELLPVNDYRNYIQHVYDEVVIGYLQQKPENSRQTELFSREFHLTHEEAVISISSTIKDLMEI